MPKAMIAKVIAITGHDARLWKKGILRVRIMCTMSVCDSNPSTNHPDWKSACISADWHLKRYHISR